MRRLPWLIFPHWKWRLPWLIFLHWKWRHPNLCSLYQTIRSYSGSHHLVSELRLLIQVLSYPILFFFLCNLSRFVFCSCSVICFLVCVLLHSCLCLCFVLVLVLVMFLFLFLFLISFRLCVKKKLFEFCFNFEKKKKKRKKKVGVWSLNTKLRQLEALFLFGKFVIQIFFMLLISILRSILYKCSRRFFFLPDVKAFLK